MGVALAHLIISVKRLILSDVSFNGTLGKLRLGLGGAPSLWGVCSPDVLPLPPLA